MVKICDFKGNLNEINDYIALLSERKEELTWHIGPGGLIHILYFRPLEYLESSGASSSKLKLFITPADSVKNW